MAHVKFHVQYLVLVVRVLSLIPRRPARDRTATATEEHWKRIDFFRDVTSPIERVEVENESVSLIALMTHTESNVLNGPEVEIVNGNSWY